jgi:hypothetical protein
VKTKFLFPYWCRYLGVGLILGHIPIAYFGEINGWQDDLHNGVSDGRLFNNGHLFFMGTALLMVIGLFLFAFAKEKIEDEQISQIRLDSLRWAIYLNYLILIVSLVFIRDADHILELNLWAPLLFFIIRFRWVIFRINLSISRED